MIKILQLALFAFLLIAEILPANAQNMPASANNTNPDSSFTKFSWNLSKPNPDAIQGFKCDTTDKPTCNNEAVKFAIAYCSAAAASYRKSANELSRSDVFMFGFATLATVAGASSLASAKLWGLLGGATGINIGWSKATDSMLADRNSETNYIVDLESNDIMKLLDDPKYQTEDMSMKALVIAARCTTPPASSGVPPTTTAKQ